MPSGSVADIMRGADLDLADLATTPFAQDTSLNASSPLPSLPADATKAIVSATGDGVRWRPDGSTTAPTASVGMYIPENTSVLFKGTNAALTALRFIEGAASAQIDVIYFR